MVCAFHPQYWVLQLACCQCLINKYVNIKWMLHLFIFKTTSTKGLNTKVVKEKLDAMKWKQLYSMAFFIGNILKSPGGRWESKRTRICSEPIVGENWEENGKQRRELAGIRVGTIICSLSMQYIPFLWSFEFLVKFLNWWNDQVDLYGSQWES